MAYKNKLLNDQNWLRFEEKYINRLDKRKSKLLM